jgi:phenylalanyl-tRNA synthetase beta chain
MLVSYRWLRELVPALETPPADLARRLSLVGLTVDAIQPFGAALDQVVVAQVRKLEPHPERSGLTLVTVDRGSGNELGVVCGASNVPEPGGLVALAPLGATLPGQEPLLPRKIGGIESAGMLVSELELGLAADAEGILVLPKGCAESGSPLSQALPYARDTIFEIDVTPNRPDALGHVGIARDVAALLKLPFSPPVPKPPKRTAELALADLIEIDNQDLERCPHYGAALVVDVRVSASPPWLRYRLSSLGIRPISNIVDITNLLLLEFAQPMHAFDLDRVRGARVVIRRASAGEPFTTLDGVVRQLNTDDLVICDAEGPTALAGVMGGLDSEIKDTTRRVLLECAYFTPRGIRRTARRHGMHTESSHRFERGTDRDGVPRVLDHAVSLLTELASGKAVPGAIHAKAPSPPISKIKLRSERLNALLGVEVPFADALAILEHLGLTIASRSETSAEVAGVSFRPDIQIEADLIEEVARIRGLERIPTIVPKIVPQPPRPTGKLERLSAEHAVALGLSEALTYAFVAAEQLEAVHAAPAVVRLSNPLSEERNVMRTSLLPGLLEALRRARRRGEQSVRLFSVGPRFLSPPSQPSNAYAVAARPPLEEDFGVLPEERPSFAALLAGLRPAHLTVNPEQYDVLDAKGIACELVERLSGRKPSVEHVGGRDDAAHLHPRGAAELALDGLAVGKFGPLHPDVVAALDLGGDAQIVELDLAAIEALGKPTPKYRPIPRLPAIVRDLSFVVHDDIAAAAIERIIVQAGGELCESVAIVGEFRGGSVPAEHRSVTFRIVYRDPRAATDPDAAHTLTDKEVEARQEQILRTASAELGVMLRG